MDLKQFIQEQARRYRESTAIICGNQRLSHREVDEISNRFANALLGTVNKGDRVAILLPSSIEFVITYLGTVKVGGIAVPLDARYKVSELTSVFNNCQPSVLVAESDCLEQLMPDLSCFTSVKKIIEVGSRYKGRFLNYEELLAAGSPGRVDVKIGENDIVHIGYTSGPTSHPLGAVLTHGNLLSETSISVTAYSQTEKDVMMLFALPMNHVFGLIPGLLGTLSSGGRVVILTGRSLTTLMELIEREKGTIFMGVPYIFALLVHMAEQEGLKNDVSSLRLCISGGDYVPDDVALKFKKLYGLDIDQIWGLTEATCAVTCTAMSNEWKLGSAGRAIGGWVVKAIDDKGRELPPGQPGELIAGKGPLMQCYYRNPEATAAILKNGWLHTGDIGRIDKDGDVFIIGRKKNMIITKGQNIFPVDIEEVLNSCPLVSEAVVVGVPDKLRGEIVGAAIVMKKGQVTTDEDIRRYCRQYFINYKVPRRIMFLSSLPRTADGKVNLDYTRKLFIDSLPTSQG